MARAGDSTASVVRPVPSRSRRPAPAPAATPTLRRRPSHLRVVGPVARRRRRAGLAVGALCLTFFAAAVGVVAFQAQLAQNQLVLDKLDAQYRDELRTYEQYRAQLAQLQSPSYVLPMADRLGLRRADPIYVSPSAAVTAEVLAAVGPDDARRGTGPAGAAPVRPDWSSVKPIVGSAP